MKIPNILITTKSLKKHDTIISKIPENFRHVFALINFIPTKLLWTSKDDGHDDDEEDDIDDCIDVFILLEVVVIVVWDCVVDKARCTPWYVAMWLGW